ncbi:unnamed protein product [Fusarium equiseti]|uniref:Uncharacterized protein n=1 Tax=Fusarium equiseti TaxID=61235 RepID=A0A8J2IIF4_FUSEQ|nr:unnamed protein product [Fusarium equiseti]
MADRDDSDHDMTPAPGLEAEQGQDSNHEAEPEQNVESDRDIKRESESMELDSIPSIPEESTASERRTPRPDASPQSENSGPEASSPYPEGADPDRDYPEEALSQITSPSNDLPEYAPPQNAPSPDALAFDALALDGFPDAPPMDPGPLVLSDSDDSSPPPDIPIDPELKDPDFPIATIEEPNVDSSRRSSVQSNVSLTFDGSDPARDTTVASTAPPQSPTPRPMPPVGPFRPIAPRPPGIAHNPQVGASSEVLPFAPRCPSIPPTLAIDTSIGPFPSTIPLPPDTVYDPQRDTIPGLAPTAPMHSHSTPNGGPTNGHRQQYPQRNNAPRNGESSTNGQRQQQPPNHTNVGQRGTALPDSQHEPRGDNAQQNEENGRVISVTPRRPPLDHVVRRLSQIAEDQEDGAPSNETTSPGYVLTAQNSVEGTSNGLPENNAHQNGAQQPPHTNGQHNRTAPQERTSRFVERFDLDSQTDGSVVNGAPPNSAAPSGPTSPSEEKDSEEEL